MNKLSEYSLFLNNFNLVGSTTLVIDNNKFKQVITKGYQSIENKIPTSPNTIYKIASISKVIVAIGLLKLVEKKLIDLDKDISNYLNFKVRNPYFPSKIITLRMLLTQTSSICDTGGFIDNVYKGYFGANQTDDFIPLEDLLNPNRKHYYNTFSNNLPGSNFEYSNFGCGILACVCEKITKIHFRDYIKKVLLDELDIDGGFRVKDIKHQDLIAAHYKFIDNKFSLFRDKDSFIQNECIEYPIGENYRGVAGGLYISAVDLSKIMEMLMNKGIYQDKKILEIETVNEMESVQWKDNCSDPTYKQKGLQLIIMDDFSKDLLYGHFGNAYGLRSFMLYNEHVGYIFLCNGGDFVTDEEHMTIVEKEIIQYLVSKTKYN
ncbi:MAG: beta-lactamase family protein [Bacilli bacterium]|nr:beta-lactamase family protein [Bacilli bacterium]